MPGIFNELVLKLDLHFEGILQYASGSPTKIYGKTGETTETLNWTIFDFDLYIMIYRHTPRSSQQVNPSDITDPDNLTAARGKDKCDVLVPLSTRCYKNMSEKRMNNITLATCTIISYEYNMKEEI